MFWLKRAIQAVPSACSRWPPVGSGALRSKTPMLSSPRKPPSKTFLPKRSLRFTHQVKFSISLLNAALEEIQVRLAAQGLLGAVEEQGRPGVDRGVHVAEVPLVGGNLAAGVQVDPAEHQFHLLLGEVGVHDGERQRVEGQVPGRVPGVLPLVGHGDDVLVQHVEPLRVPGRCGYPGWSGLAWCSSSQLSPSKKKNCLLQSMPAMAWRITLAASGDDRRRGDRLVELVRLLQPGGQDLVKLRAERGAVAVVFWLSRQEPGHEAQPHGCRLAGADRQLVVGRDLGALLLGVHRALFALHHAVVDAVLDIGALVLLPGKSRSWFVSFSVKSSGTSPSQ